ncbi:MAG: HDIG domain-containing metalloprotein [Mycobacterium sp.]
MADELPRRWLHVQSVAEKAERIAPAFGNDGAILSASAWLHDIGYSSSAAKTGFHALDGALYLRGLGEPPSLNCLVANHSGALAEAELRGLESAMYDFPDADWSVRDALWACDMTTGPSGDSVSFTERLDEIRRRYRPDDFVPVAIDTMSKELRKAIRRTATKVATNDIFVDLRI